MFVCVRLCTALRVRLRACVCVCVRAACNIYHDMRRHACDMPNYRARPPERALVYAVCVRVLMACALQFFLPLLAALAVTAPHGQHDSFLRTREIATKLCAHGLCSDCVRTLALLN